jgi:methylglutaconyl-CoA hydratase
MSVGMKRARELMLSAREVAAPEALSLGLANSVTAQSSLMGESCRWAALINKNSPQAMASTKRLLFEQFKLNSFEDMKLATKLNALARHSSECKEGVQAFLAKRPPSWCN